MKKGILLIYAAILLTGCYKDSDTRAERKVSKPLLNDGWYASRDWSSLNNLTTPANYYPGTTFEFKTKWVVIAKQNAMPIETGAWSNLIIRQETHQLFIQFPGNTKYPELNSSWWVPEFTSSVIKLYAFNGTDSIFFIR